MRLSDRMTDVVVLVGRDDLSWKRTAREMGVSEHTAKEYALRVRARLGLHGHGLKSDIRTAWRMLEGVLEIGDR